MVRAPLLTRLLAMTGAILVWVPLVVPALLAVVSAFQLGGFHFDYLMPAELFPVGLVGGGLLMLAAMRLRFHRALIGCGLAGMIVMLIGCQTVAVVTGLASGAAEPAGWRLVLVTSLLGLYILALLIVAISGVLLVRRAIQGRGAAAPIPAPLD